MMFGEFPVVAARSISDPVNRRVRPLSILTPRPTLCRSSSFSAGPLPASNRVRHITDLDYAAPAIQGPRKFHGSSVGKQYGVGTVPCPIRNCSVQNFRGRSVGRSAPSPKTSPGERKKAVTPWGDRLSYLSCLLVV